MDDLAPILDGARLPALTSLGLCNSVLANKIAAALPTAPIASRLERLDLSYGTLHDVGAQALLTPGALPRLRTLNVTHHFLSPEMEQRLKDQFAVRDAEVRLAGSRHRFAASDDDDWDDDDDDDDDWEAWDERLKGRYIRYHGEG